MKDVSNAEVKTVNIHDLVIDLIGHWDKPTGDLITYHAKKPKPPGEKGGGLGSVPSAFLTGTPGGANPKQRFSYKLTEESRTFFRNLLDLESVLPSRIVAAILMGEHLMDTPETKRELAKARRNIEVKWLPYANWLRDWPDLEQRLLNPKTNLRTQPLLSVTSPTEATTSAVSLSLHMVRRLEEIDKHPPRDLDGAGIQAAKVLLLIDLGALDVAESMLDDVLKELPNHAQANYAYAMLYLRKMRTHVQQANHFHMMRTEVDPDHASHWVHDEDEEICKVLDSKSTALQRLTRAYAAWPSSGTAKHRYWLDHLRRDHVLAVIFQLAFEFAHEHAGGDLMNLLKLRDRREGRPVEAYFSAEVDTVVLAVAKEIERSQPLQMRCTSFQRKTMLVQIYSALSPDEYRRFLPLWVNEFTTKYTDAVEAAIVPGWQGRNVMANVVREHLRRALGPDEIAKLLGDLEARCVEANHAFHAEVLAFMNKVDNEDDEYSESFGDW
jgi:hypothetical protein